MRFAFGLLGLVGCSAQVSGQQPDSGAADAPVAIGQSVSGRTLDYFTGLPLATTTLVTDGLQPQILTTSATDASYTLDPVPPGSKLFVSASRNMYRPTRSLAIDVAAQSIMEDLYAMSVADTSRQYVSLGKTATPGDAILFAEMQLDNGQPVVGIPLANVKLLDGAMQPVAGVLGPYFIGTVGDIDPAATTSAAYGTPPRARVAFLDVPPGSFSLAVTYTPSGGGAAVTSTAAITAIADGAVLALTGGSPPGPMPGNPRFATDVYPILQRAAQGGAGCANCHTASGPGAVLQYDLPADQVLANAKAITGVIDTTTPANSLLLTKPLYEQPPTPQNHPNATWLGTEPAYLTIATWIAQGAVP
jgi:hypothetical protein